MKRILFTAAALLLLLPGIVVAQPTQQFCGMSPRDWCASPPGDPCGTHRNERECRADRRCQGMPYRGESVVGLHAGRRRLLVELSGGRLCFALAGRAAAGNVVRTVTRW